MIWHAVNLKKKFINENIYLRDIPILKKKKKTLNTIFIFLCHRMGKNIFVSLPQECIKGV